MTGPLCAGGGSNDLQDPQSFPHGVAANARLLCQDRSSGSLEPILRFPFLISCLM